jgi:TPR repeat protein
MGSILEALQSLASKNSAFAMEDWRAIASEARAGSAPAQYIVATAFEGLGDFTQVRNWYKRSATQQYRPAVLRLAVLQSGSDNIVHC